jgi:transposase
VNGYIDSNGGMDVEQLKEDVREGRITPDRLVDVIVALQRRIDELERQLGASAARRLAEAFSVRAEEQRQAARGKKPGKRKRRYAC